MSAADKVRERVDNGLCPQCGEEAAPYYLCYVCRQQGRVRRSLKRLADQGHATKRKEGGKLLWQIVPGTRDAPRDKRWETPVVPNDSDRRFHPKIGGIPVNVEAQIWKLCESFDREFSIDDVVQAWGRLRGEKRKKGSAAADVRAILAADEKRRRRAEKRGAVSPDPVFQDSPIVISARAGE